VLLTPEGKEYWYLILFIINFFSVFTGDTLFIGDVGRPDLATKSDVTKEDLAGMLYDSLRNKVMKLS
jgi:glyoxylase-like metal-dependent hydrolase (beta-lactamase superfamily II)